MRASRYLRSLILALIITSLIVPFMPSSFAAYAEEEGQVEVASDIEEYIDATEPAEDPDPVFGTRRIKVKLVLDSLEGAKEGVTYDGSTLLSYETVAETRAAYEMLVEKYGAENVVIDMPIMVAESSARGWGTDYMNFDDEMKRETGSSSAGRKVTVAIIDSGIFGAHDVFSGKTINASSRSMLSEDDSIADQNGHGTEVAGIVAESTPDNVELMILKAFNDGTRISSETVCQSIRYAADQEADVINLSMSTNFKTPVSSLSDEVLAVIDELEYSLRYASDQGVIICAASGNGIKEDGVNVGKSMDDYYTYPAVSEYTIAVGAIDRNGSRAAFSNYGSTLDFCAPGAGITTASMNISNGYVLNGNGTSLATPYISACCAFVKMNNPDADKSAAKNYLKDSAKDLGDTGWDMYYGWGVPVYKEYSEPAPPPAVIDPKKITSVTVNKSTVTAKVIKSAIRKAGGSSKYVKKIVLGSKVKKISSNAFKNTKATSVVVGKNVRTISKYAFKGSKVKTLTVKTKKLTKKSVKYSLRSSRVTTVKVNVGSTKTNKSYVKRYKRYFTKKNAGRKVTVKR